MIKIYVDDKQTSKKQAADLCGEERIEEMIAEAREAFAEDPNEEISWYIGGGRYLRIEIEY